MMYNAAVPKPRPRRFKINDPQHTAVGLIVKRCMDFLPGDAKTSEVAVMHRGDTDPEICELLPSQAYWWLQLYGDMALDGVPATAWTVADADDHETGMSYPIVYLSERDCDAALEAIIAVKFERTPVEPGPVTIPQPDGEGAHDATS